MAALHLAGQDFELRYTLRALKTLEQLAGISVTAPEFAGWASTVTGLSVILWQGLLTSRPEMTQQEVDDMVDMSDMPRITEAISEAFGRDLGADKAAAANGSGPDPNANGAAVRTPAPLLTGTTPSPSEHSI